MKRIIEEVFQAEDKVSAILKQARERASELKRSAEKEASEMVSQARRQAQETTQALLEDAKKEAERLRQEKLQQAQQEAESMLQLNDAATGRLVQQVCDAIVKTEWEKDS